MTITPNMTAEEIARKFVTLAGKDKDNVAFNGRHFKHINDPDSAEIACGRYREHITELAAAIIDAHRPKWIPGSEPPKDASRVWAHWTEEGQEDEPSDGIASYHDNRWHYHDDVVGWSDAIPPIAWQHLPTPPEAK